jgi:hypothetical protein
MEENKLFIICPFSNIESFLRKEYGNDILFMTYSGSMIQYADFDFLNHVKDIILQEKIKQIFFVNDINCKFIEDAIMKKRAQSQVSTLLEEYYIHYYFSLFQNTSKPRQKYNLAKINLFYQIQEFSNSYHFKEIIASKKIELHGIITDKIKNLKKQIKNKVYEF